MKTDTQLQSDVIAELKWEPSINAERSMSMDLRHERRSI
jgi:hypothetical protein